MKCVYKLEFGVKPESFLSHKPILTIKSDREAGWRVKKPNCQLTSFTKLTSEVGQSITLHQEFLSEKNTPCYCETGVVSRHVPD